MLSETLRCIRVANENMKVKEVAKEIGISWSYISEIETNKKKVSLKTLKKLSSLYNIPLSKIMELDEYNDECTDFSFQKTLIKVLEYYIANNECERNTSNDKDQIQFVKVRKVHSLKEI